MDERDKEILMKSIIHDNDAIFIDTYNNFNLVLDESFFDYELLKASLDKKRGTIANFLVNKGHRVRNPNKINLEETPLHLAMKLEDPSVISAILNNYNASIYDKNLQGETPLYAAFRERCYRAKSVMLDYISNSDLDFNPDNKDDVLHFHIACISNHIASVKLYLSLGFDVNSYLSIDSAEFAGLTPLHYLTSINDYDDLFTILLEHSDLTIKNSSGLTPLHSIYYNYNDHYNADDDTFHLFVLCTSMTKVFKHGNDTKFINAVDNSGVSHFHLCCATDCADCAQIFIDNGVDVNSSISFNCSRNPGYTALHFAAKHACLEVVELLLKNGADCNRADKNGVTPLHLASTSIKADMHIKIIELLLQYNASPIAVDEAGDTPIHLAFYQIIDFDEIEDVRYINIRAENILDKLLSKKSLALNVSNNLGISFFHIVCTRNNTNQVTDFLNSGVAIDSVSHSSKFPGYTGLHFAVAFNQKDVVEILLKTNAQVNIETGELKNTPLHLACEFTLLRFSDLESTYYAANEQINLDCTSNRTTQLDIIKLLLLHGADVDAKNKFGLSPLFTAFCKNDEDLTTSSFFENILLSEISPRLKEITNILLSNKANINDYPNDQQSIFHAFTTGYLLKVTDELMECLIAAGADINAVDEDGFTPLHLAAHWSKNELVQTFLKHKANVNAKCKNFQTPLQMAVKRYISYDRAVYDGDDIFFETFDYQASMKCMYILLENGSDVNIRNKNGSTLLHYVVLYSVNTLIIFNLLVYGADINIEDSLGKSPVCSLFMNGYEYRVNVSRVIFIHTQKLLALGLFVSDKVKKFCTDLQQYCKTLTYKIDYATILDNSFDECNNELKKMKMKKIDNYTSLYSILLKDQHQLSKHVRNQTLIDILEGENTDDEQFPLYNYLLKLQYKKGLLRSDVLQSAKASIMYIADLNLPDPCCDSVFKYLTNEDILNLKIAIDVRDSFKRKLNDNENEMNPAMKLQKRCITIQ